MAKNVSQIVKEAITPIIEQLGYYLLDVEYGKKIDGMNLDITIDNANGILIEDCEKVHHAIDSILDEINPTEDKPYILNVSSPGLDRPIKNARDFERNFDKKVEVKLYAQQNGKKSYVGILKEYNQDVTILCEEKLISFKLSDVAIITPIIEL